MTDIEVTGLGKRFGAVDALSDVSFSLSGRKICGLLGRNGAGKTTLLSILAGYERQTRGTVRVDGVPVFENAAAAAATCLVRGTGDASSPSVKVRDLVELAGRLRHGWDAGYASELLDRFAVPRNRPPKELSHGKRCALGVTMGLASRAAVTIFDESYLGMDTPSRYAFYDALLADVLEHPRTVIISTHLIEEVGTLFEDVLILDEGRLLLHEEADTLRAAGAAVTGDATLVDSFTLGLEVLGEKSLGRTKSTVVYGPLDEIRRTQAREVGLDLDPIALQDLFVHLTSGGSR
jgi:ABC-2 type transport system ATP-binding protein